ncbi:porin [Vreelandella stevensii]|uniref:porin n=1 Tax=Vreelandella stevensii TaxID=502821 RepID=UPI00403B0054
MPRRFVSSLAIFLAIYSGVTTADSSLPSATLNGFGTLGVVHADISNADFVADPLASSGAGFSGHWSAEVDSRLGLQTVVSATSTLSATVQVVSEKRFDGSYAPEFEWAYLQFDATPQLSLRAGRMVQGSFLNSEYRKVNYATPWVRPPGEVYRLIPVANFDGADLRYRYSTGAFVHDLRLSYGGGSVKYASGDIEASDSWGISQRTQWGDVTLFASYGELSVSAEELTQFFDIYRLFGPPGEALANRYEVDGKVLRVLGLGVGYDPGPWFAQAEWARLSSASLVGRGESAHATAGYRFGNLTPFAAFGRARVLSDTFEPGLDPALYPSPFAEGALLLNGALNALLSSGLQQDSRTLGLRWDFRPGMALTAQYDHLDFRSGSPGGLINQQSGFQPGGAVNVFSLALDFVF